MGEKSLEDPMEITFDSMEDFIKLHGHFVMGISSWVMTRAGAKDFFSVNHFFAAMRLLMLEVGKKVEGTTENLADTEWWKKNSIH